MLWTCRTIALRALSITYCTLALNQVAYAEWQALGPYGGAAEAVLVAPGDPKTLLAATRNALLYRSSDAGAHWSPLTFHESLSFSVRVMRVAGEGSQAAYFLGGVSAPSTAVPLYVSRDTGVTWEPVTTLPVRAVYSLAAWSKDPRMIVAGTDTGVFRSNDSGATWTRISPGDHRELRFITALAIDPESRDSIYAGTGHLPWKTGDGGKTWTSIHKGMIDDSDVFSIDIDPAETRRVLASACSGIYLSENGGESWVKVLGVPNTSRRTYIIRRDPVHPRSLYAGTSQGLWKSANNGVAWTKISSAVVKSIAFTGDRLYLATENSGLVVSKDQGKTFQIINDGFVNSNLRSLAESNGELLATSPYDQAGVNLLRLSMAGAWTTVKPPAGVKPANLLSISPAGGLSMAGVTSNAGFLTTNGGKTWTKLGDGRGRVHAVHALGPKAFLLATSQGLYRTTDGGLRWTTIVPDVDIAAIYASPVRIVADAGNTLFTSADAGQTWTPVSSPVNPGELYGIASGAQGVVLAATARGVFRSSDAGRSWLSIDQFPSTVRAVAFDAQGVVSAAIHEGTVYLSNDAGENWTPMDMTGIESATITALIIPVIQNSQSEPSRIFAATHARGVFVSSTSGSSLPSRAPQASAATAADGNTIRSNQSRPR